MCDDDATAVGMLTSHLCDFDLLQLLLGQRERGRIRAGGHMMLVALQTDVLLVLQTQTRGVLQVSEQRVIAAE